MSEDESSADQAELSADDDGETFDEKKHASLLRSITALDGKAKPSSERREVMSMSEHHTPSLKGPVKIHQLVGALRNKIGHQELKKQIHRVKKKEKVLPVPLPKPQQQRIHRSLAYENVSKQLSKWDPIVWKNRLAEQIIYPLEKPDIQILTSPNELVKRIQPKTALETEVAALLGEHQLGPEKVLTPAEEKALKAMSIEEARRRRAELQKYRALLSYKEAKARRQNKIKSKKYHRILRKEKLKKEQKLLEELERTDPEALLEKLKEMDANRIQERISLKHRGGSKFARKQMIYNKYSDKSREAVQEMLQKSRELSKKIVAETDSSDADASGDEEIVTKQPEDNSTNPWMSSGSKTLKKSTYSKPDPVHNVQNDMSDTEDGNSETDVKEGEKDVMEVNIDSLFDKLEEKNVKTVRQMKHLTVAELDDEDSEESEVEEAGSKPDVDEVLSGQNSEKGTISMSVKRKQTLEDFDVLPNNVESDEEVSDKAEVKELTPEVQETSPPKDKESKSSELLNVDPKKFIKIGSKLETVTMAEGEQFDEDQMQNLSIAQAFASDDVIQEFTEEKKSIQERDKPKDINLVLPGWGEWGGTGVKVSKRKRRRFILKAPPAAPRKDKNLDNVIISEVKDNTITKHQVSDVPFPFTDPKQFENSIRQPIGKTWNPETAYKKLIEPKKVTFSGKIIPPMDKNQVNNNIKEDGLKPRKKMKKGKN